MYKCYKRDEIGNWVVKLSLKTGDVDKKNIASNLLSSLCTMLYKDTYNEYGKYGNRGCGVFKGGIQNYKVFG